MIIRDIITSSVCILFILNSVSAIEVTIGHPQLPKEGIVVEGWNEYLELNENGDLTNHLTFFVLVNPMSKMKDVSRNTFYIIIDPREGKKATANEHVLMSKINISIDSSWFGCYNEFQNTKYQECNPKRWSNYECDIIFSREYRCRYLVDIEYTLTEGFFVDIAQKPSLTGVPIVDNLFSIPFEGHATKVLPVHSLCKLHPSGCGSIRKEVRIDKRYYVESPAPDEWGSWIITTNDNVTTYIHHGVKKTFEGESPIESTIILKDIGEDVNIILRWTGFSILFGAIFGAIFALSLQDIIPFLLKRLLPHNEKLEGNKFDKFSKDIECSKDNPPRPETLIFLVIVIAIAEIFKRLQERRGDI